jgi:hypothetical protein
MTIKTQICPTFFLFLFKWEDLKGFRLTRRQKAGPELATSAHFNFIAVPHQA